MDIDKYILSCASLVFIDDQKQIKYHLINKLFHNLKRIRVFGNCKGYPSPTRIGVEDLDFAALLSELQKITNTSTSKLDRVEVYARNVNMDILSIYKNKFKAIKWNMSYKFYTNDTQITLHRTL